MGKKHTVELALDLSVAKDLTGVLIRNKDGLNVSQRFVQGPLTKHLGYRFISDEVLRRMTAIAKLKIMEYQVDTHGRLCNATFKEGTRDDFLPQVTH